MKLFLSTSLLLSSVAAFAPTQSQLIKTNTALQNDLWGEPPKKEGESEREMSKALPFAPRPKLLDGTLAGDVGFDPFGFAGADKATLLYMREAEIKHSRLAMLAVVGWPLAELLDKPLADALHLETALTKTGASPSILNGGLQKIDNLYWLAVVALAGVVELEIQNQKEAKKAQYLPGDVGFDPLGLNPKTQEGKFSMQVKEIKHGRLAMMAILGFVAQEAIFRTPVVAETPIFFHPVF